MVKIKWCAFFFMLHIHILNAQRNHLMQEVLGDSLLLDYYEVGTDLNLPWEIVWGPDNQIWFSHDKGTIAKLNPETGFVKEMLKLPDIAFDGSIERSRMVGLTLDTQFDSSPYVYVSYNYFGDSYAPPLNHTLYLKVVRYEYNFEEEALNNPLVLLSNVQVFDGFHIGGKLLMTQDRKLLIAVGDAKQPENPELHPDWSTGDLPKPQNLDLYSGKVLRINPDGTIPSNNPFKITEELVPRNLIYTYGHRNTQGMALGDGDTVYYAEHGGSEEDELGILHNGKNNGWPFIEGFCNDLFTLYDEQEYCQTLENYQEPILSWNPDIAPSSIDYINKNSNFLLRNTIVIPTLNSEGDGFHLRLVLLTDSGVPDREIIVAKNMFGRLRDACVGPDGSIYFTTSNTMWGNPTANDDRIIQVKISRQKEITALENDVRNKLFTYQLRHRELVIENQSEHAIEYQVFTLQGKKLYDQRLESGFSSIALNSGWYLLVVIGANRSGAVKKIVVK